MQDPLIGALRRATAHQHADIERLLGLGEVFELHRYHQVLRSLEAFLSRWEPLLAARLPASLAPWLAGRSRLAMLRQDMEVLEVAPLPRACMADIPDAAAAWGSLYVMEGSALGGQIVSRALACQHGIAPESGGAYFHGFGERTGSMWREFQHLLEREAGDPSSRRGACDGAVATFEALAATFRLTEHEHAAA